MKNKPIQRGIGWLFTSIYIVSMSACAESPGSKTQANSSAKQPAVIIECSNTLKDAERINEAIANSKEGSEIMICGECLINETIRLLDNRSYQGESRTGTILKQADGANLDAIVASSGFLENKPYTDSPVFIRNIHINGNRKNNTKAATAGLVMRSWLSVVEYVQIKNMGGDGIRLTNISSDGTGLKSTQVNGRIANNFITHSGGHGVFIQDSQNAVTDWILSDNWIASSGKDGIHMDNAAGWYVERNHIYGVPQNAIYAHRLFGTSISNNYIEGFGETNKTGNWYGIYASLQGDKASTIANNRIFNFHDEKNPSSNYRYLALSVNYDTAMVVVSDNAIQGNGTPYETGLYYDSPEDFQLDVTSKGNAVRKVGKKRFVGKNVMLNKGL